MSIPVDQLINQYIDWVKNDSPKDSVHSILLGTLAIHLGSNVNIIPQPKDDLGPVNWDQVVVAQGLASIDVSAKTIMGKGWQTFSAHNGFVPNPSFTYDVSIDTAGVLTTLPRLKGKPVGGASPSQMHVLSNGTGLVLTTVQDHAVWTLSFVRYAQIFDPCASILASVPKLQEEEAELSEELLKVKGIDEKKAIAKQISTISKQIGKLRQQYNSCRIDHGGKPDQPMKASVDATITLFDDNGSATIVVPPFSMDIIFKAYDHHYWTVTKFPPLTVTRDGHTVIVTMAGNGLGSYISDSGQITLDLPLHFDIPVYYDSNIDFLLSSANMGGSALVATNTGAKTTLTAKANFKDGHLEGDLAILTMTLTLPILPD